MSQVTESKLRSWLEESQRCGATHMLLVVDRTEDFKASPVKVYPHENVHEVEDFYSSLDGNEVTEIYNLSYPLEEQLGSKTPVFLYA